MLGRAKVLTPSAINKIELSMGRPKLDKMVLERKKKTVRETIYRACEAANLPIPTINFEGCPLERDNELAHYHPDQNKICFSERELYIQNSDELERTAIHEVAHILELNHGPDFVQTNLAIRAKAWKPPSGVTYVRGDNSPREKSDDKPLTIDKTICNYPKCGKKNALKQCPDCERYFCAEHLTQRIVTNRHEITSLDNDYDYEKWKKYTSDWQIEDGHACPQYTERWNKEYKEKQNEKEKYIKTSLKGGRKQYYTSETTTRVDPETYLRWSRAPKKKSLSQRIKDALGIL